MRNVDLVFGYLIDSPNGVSSVVRLLKQNKELFEKNGVVCNFHVRGNADSAISASADNNHVLVKHSAKSRIKKSVKSILDFSTRAVPLMHTWFTIYNTLMLPGKKIAKSYTAKESPDCQDPLFFNDLFSCYYYLKITKAKRRPALLVIHSDGEVFKMLKFSFPEIEGSWIMRKLDKIIEYTFSRVSDFGFVAKNAMDHFAELYPQIDRKRIHYVHNGIPQVKFPDIEKRQEARQLELCCVGSLSYRKGQDIIIKALSQLTPEERSRIHVTFVGDGYIRKDLEEYCEKMGIGDCVAFAGNRTDVDDFLRRSDIFILTSRDEGFPMAILEAERAGLPVISTKIAGIPEMIVDGETGLLINPSEHELLPIFKNIATYDWKAMGERSKNLFYEKFTIEKMIEGYCNIFKDMEQAKG